MSVVFDHPWMFTCLAVLPVLAALAWYSRRRRRRDLNLLGSPQAIGSRDAATRLGWMSVLALLVVAAAGPRWGAGPPSATKPGSDVMLVVDLSRSMLAQDALPDRLERGKAALGDLIDAVQARGGHRIGIVAFAGQAQVVCPLTHDYEHVRSKVATLSADPLPAALESQETSGTRIGAGLAAAVSAHDPNLRGAQLIVLLSDGDDPANDEEWRTGLAFARNAGIPVHVVGIGDPANESRIPQLEFRGQPVQSRMHEAPLREIAARTGGSFLSNGVSKPDLAGFVRETMNRHAMRESVGGLAPQLAARQMWFLLPALGLALWLLLPRLSWKPRVAMSGAAMLLIAATSASNRDLRRGLAAMDAGQFEQALAHFAVAGERTTDPGLLAFNEGIALYHLGRFREAEQRFRWSLSDADGARRANALYNLGCALLQQSQGRLAEPLRNAVDSFEQSQIGEALDVKTRGQAKDNLALAKKLLAQLPPESPKHGDTSSSSSSNRPSTDSIQEANSPAAGAGDRDATQVIRDGKADGSNSQQTDRLPPPGKGSLPALADDDALAPLTPADAQAHLERATARIAAARAAQLRSRAKPPSTRFPDW